MKIDENTIALGGLMFIVAAAIYAITSEDRAEIKKAKIQAEAEKSYPPEYWVAKAKEAEASVEKHRIDVESKERLELDRRDRDALEATNRREFEKDAPKEYWEHKKIAEEEATKRECERQREQTKRDMEHERLEADKYIARKNSDAIKDGVQSVSRALRGASSWSY